MGFGLAKRLPKIENNDDIGRPMANGRPDSDLGQEAIQCATLPEIDDPGA